MSSPVSTRHSSVSWVTGTKRIQSEIDQQVEIERRPIPSSNGKRTETRKLSSISNGAWRSLQSCSLRDNLAILESHIKSRTSKSNFQLFSHQGLKAILNVILAQLPFGGRTTQLSFLRHLVYLLLTISAAWNTH